MRSIDRAVSNLILLDNYKHEHKKELAQKIKDVLEKISNLEGVHDYLDKDLRIYGYDKNAINNAFNLLRDRIDIFINNEKISIRNTEEMKLYKVKTLENSKLMLSQAIDEIENIRNYYQKLKNPFM